MNRASKFLRIVAGNLLGWRTGRKIVVIESDDWGSFRMDSDFAYESLKNKGVDVDSGDSERFNRFDTLETDKDLVALFEILSRHRDRSGSPAKFTPMCLVANPDFERIRSDQFRQYSYKTLPQSCSEMPGRAGVMGLYREGISSGLFSPEFHGREHLHVPEWMRALRAGKEDVRAAFDVGCWGFTNHHPSGFQYQAAFDVVDADDVLEQAAILTDGLKLFRNIFGYSAVCFVPPNGPISRKMEPVSSNGGILFMSTAKLQVEPLGNGRSVQRLHFLGQRNKWGQIYMTRNCIFEPGIATGDRCDTCLSEIQTAFSWHKPAVISTHRVNYIGARSERNRTLGLNALDQLLSRALKRWPDVEFMTTRELGKLVYGNARA